MATKTIRVSCKGSGTLPIDQIKPLQGDLKSLSKEAYEKLRGLILKNGITAPIHVWKDSKGKHWNLDGHQRVNVLGKLREEGFKIPPVPVVQVEASNIRQAREILLSNVAQYGKVERQGLYEFMHEAGFDYAHLMSNFEVPGIDMNLFGVEFFKQPQTVEFKVGEGAREIDEGEFSKFDHRCPKCKYEWSEKK